MPFVLKDRCWQMCIDCSTFNRQKVKYRSPLPRIVMLLEKLVLSKVFTKPHLASGYHKIAMKCRSIYITAVHH